MTGERRRVVTFDTSGRSAAEVPILVRLDATRIDYAAAGDGASVYFADANGNALSHEVERWDPNGSSWIWVRPNSIVDGGQFELRYGGVAPGPNSEPVFRDYELVLHFAGNGAVNVADSSPANAGATLKNGPGRIDDFLGGAISLDGLDDFVEVTSDELLADRSQLSLSAWVKTDDDAGAIIEVEATDSSITRAFIDLGATTTAASVRALDTTAINSLNGPAVTRGQWQWVVFQIDFVGKSLGLFYDGVIVMEAEDVNLPDGTIGTAAARAVIGRDDTTTSLALEGTFDEVRIGNRIDSADAIAIQHAAMTDTLLQFGPEQ